MSIHRVAGWTSSTVVAIAVVCGLVLSGSPREQRLKRLDERRIADLRTLASYVDRSWRKHEELPADLGALLDGVDVARIPSDPATGLNYEYVVAGPREYRLCATFQTTPDRAAGTFWDHQAGRQCFEFEVPKATGT